MTTKYTDEFKAEAVAAAVDSILKGDMTIADVATKREVPERTLRTWLRKEGRTAIINADKAGKAKRIVKAARTPAAVKADDALDATPVVEATPAKIEDPFKPMPVPGRKHPAETQVNADALAALAAAVKATGRSRGALASEAILRGLETMGVRPT